MIGAILSIRAIVQFMAQIVGALILRKTRPDLPRPFKMWLFPLPAVIALVLWTFVLFSPEKGMKAAGFIVIAAGTLAFLVRSRLMGEWPFRRAA